MVVVVKVNGSSEGGDTFLRDTNPIISYHITYHLNKVDESTYSNPHNNNIYYALNFYLSVPKVR